jgi:DNA-binding CsgD family transcriptional regulator
VLRPLAASAIEALVSARYGLPQADVARLSAMLHQLTLGNALYTSELLRSYEEQGTLRLQDNRWCLGELERVHVPPLLQEVIDGRLRRLSDAALAAVQVAAVIGQDVPLDLWKSVCQLDDAALLDVTDELIEAQMLEEGSAIDRLRFHHALVQDALLATLHAPRRRVWHQRIAEACAAASRPEPDRIAHHFQQASDPRAVDWLIEAGRRAQWSHAWVEAAEHFEAAAVWLQDDEGRTREYGWLLFWSGIMRRWDDPQLGLTALQSVLRAAIQVDDPLLRFLATFYAGYLRSQFGDMWRGVMESMEACREVDTWLRAGVFDDYPPPPVQLVDPAESIDAHRRAAIKLADQPGHPICLSWGTVLTYLPWLGQIAETIEISEALTSLWPPLTERIRSMPDFGGNTGSGWADLYHGLGIAYALAGLPDDAERSFAASRSLYEVIDYRMLVGEVHAQTLDFVLIPYRTDRLDGRRYLNERVTALYTQVVDTFTADINVPLASATAWLALIEGRWSDLDAAIPAFLTSASMVSWWRMKLGAVLGYLARYRGDPDAAWEIVRELLPQADATELGSFGLVDVTMIQALAAELELDAGNVAGARRWIDAHERWMTWSGAVPGRAQGELLQARSHRCVGDTHGAATHARAALDLASSPRQPLALIAAHRCLGELALDAGQHADAAQHLDTALALSTACAVPYERALTLLALAELNAANQPDEARRGLDEVRAICEPLRAAPALTKVAEIEARLTQTRTSKRPAGLSPRETEILLMIAAGRSNKQIAYDLSMSLRTVERHSANLYAKIGAASRAEAIAFAHQDGLISD